MAKIVQKFKVDGKEVIIRYLDSKDAKGIFRMQELLFKEKAMTGMNEKPNMKDVKASLKRKVKSIKDKKIIDLVVESDGKIEGRIRITKVDDDCQDHVGTMLIHVTNELRGKGITAKMLSCGIKESKKVLKIKIITLGVMAGNKRAIGFYKKNGFKEHGLFKKGIQYFGKLVDEVLMVKYL